MSIRTWFQKDSRISFERNWDIRDVKSGRRLGMATRCCLLHIHTATCAKLMEMQVQ